MPTLKVKFGSGDRACVRACIMRHLTTKTNAEVEQILSGSEWNPWLSSPGVVAALASCLRQCSGVEVVEGAAALEYAAIVEPANAFTRALAGGVAGVRAGEKLAAAAPAALGAGARLEAPPAAARPVDVAGLKKAYGALLQVVARWTEVYAELGHVAERTVLLEEKGYAVVDGVVNTATGLVALAAAIAAWQGKEGALEVGVGLLAVRAAAFDGLWRWVKQVPQAAALARKVSENVAYGRVIRVAAAAARAAYEAMTVVDDEGERQPRPGLMDGTMPDAELLQAGTVVVEQLRTLGEALRQALAQFQEAERLFGSALLPAAKEDAGRIERGVKALVSTDAENPGIVFVVQSAHEQLLAALTPK